MGQEYASTVVSALCARSAAGHQYASTVVGAISARSAVGHKSASTVVGAIDARSVAKVIHQKLSAAGLAFGSLVGWRVRALTWGAPRWKRYS